MLRASDPAPLPDNFLEAAFRVLEVLVRAWRRLPDGIDIRGWEQLWRFVVATVIPRMQDREEGKGKGKELGQETIYEAVRFLQALLEPESEAARDGTYLDHDGGEGFPIGAMRDTWSTPQSPLMPTLFQTITFLLSIISPTPSHLPLQKSSLTLLLTVIRYLKGQHPVLASVLPGVISGISKLFTTESKGMKGEVTELAVGVVEEVVVMTLNDEDLRRLGVLRPVVDDLSQLADVVGTQALPPETSHPPSPSPSIASTSASTSKLDPFPPLSASYLSFTSTQLVNALPPILTTVSSYSSHLARLAAASLSHALVTQCDESLPLLTLPALRTLLLLFKDPFDLVRHDAAKRLRIILETKDLDASLVDLLSNSINALPRLIVSSQDSKVSDLATLIIAISDITTTYPASGRNPIAELLGSNGKVERWSWSLLDCLEFGRPSGWSAPPNASQTAALGWTTGFAKGVMPLIQNGGGDGDALMSADFPILPLRHIESPSTIRIISEMLGSLGSAGSETALHSVEYFLLFARGHRRSSVGKAVSALWVAEKLSDGITRSQVSGVDGKVGRGTRKMAREAVKILVAMDGDEDEEEDDLSAPREDSSELVPVTRKRGFNALTTLLDRPIPNGYAAQETHRLYLAAQRVLLTCNSLRFFALTSQILSSSFRPLLLNVLYTVLSHFASPQPLVREHAELALSSIAYHTNYASPSNMILDNVDYIVNVVSLRLTRARLSPQAPLVLIAMIRLVGGEIVPMVHDVVEEIFDALDDYHGYEALASGLLAVLRVLVEVMRAEVDGEPMSEERKRRRTEMRRIDNQPDPEKDFARFESWWAERANRRQQEVEEILERAPAHGWGKTKAEEEAVEEDPPQPPSDEEPLPTRTQAVCIQILEKSIYFLTHQSPFLRSRILLLIRDAIPVLAAGNREGDLLPLIDRAWSSILSRLDDGVPYVVEAAAEVIESLAEHVGDFMSKRILDHAWPRFRRMLSEQKIKDENSALSRRGAIGTDGKYTTSHRFHAAVLRCSRWVVEDGANWRRAVVGDDAVFQGVPGQKGSFGVTGIGHGSVCGVWSTGWGCFMDRDEGYDGGVGGDWSLGIPEGSRDGH